MKANKQRGFPPPAGGAAPNARRATAHPAGAGATRRRLGRATRTAVIYLLLIGGSYLFALPFVWMVGTSFKVDREMFGEAITFFPAKPVPAPASPYLDPRYYPEPEAGDYGRVRSTILRTLRERDLGLPAETHRLEQAPSIIASGIFKRLKETLPADVWRQPDAELASTVRAHITDALVAEVRRKTFRHLAFGSVRVRSFDVQESDVTRGRPIGAFWNVRAGPGRLVDRPASALPEADLVYDFRAEGKQEVVLSSTFDLPFLAQRLYRIQISLQPDDSWHALDFFVEKNGKRYRTVRPRDTGRFRSTVVTLQEYGPDDAVDATQLKLWIPYREVDAGPQYVSDPQRVKVTAVLRESSQLDAWLFKCLRNYRRALDYMPFWRYAATSAYIVILNIIGNIFSCSLVAYAFARLHWPGRNVGFGLMMATMMIPPQVTMIPFFLIIKHIGWYNTLLPLWAISFFGNAFNIFLLRQFMKGIPRDLEDAARIDGCHFLHIYWYVIMPLIKPTLAVISIFTFMTVWNDFMGPLIFLSDQRLYPLSLGLYALNVQEGGNFGMMMASALLMTLPVIVIFFFAQRYFIQGVTLTGMKG